MSRPETVAAALDQASAAITASDVYTKTKTEQRLDRVGDGVEKATQFLSIGGALSSDNTNDAFSVIKEKVDNFVQDSKYAMSILDEIGKIHPVIQVAVSAFKVALNLELTRRGNDEKVLALKVQMKDMMSTLYVLRNVDQDEGEMAEVLSERMYQVTVSIKLCAEVCEAYQKQKLLVKFFASHSWEGKFADVSRQFEEHTAKLQRDLAVHTNRAVNNANQMLFNIQTNIDRLMKLIFERLRTGEEQEISTFVTSKGGAEKVLKSDALMGELMKTQQLRDDHPKYGPVNDDRFATTVLDVRRDATRDLEIVLAENRRTFEQKFEAQQIQMDKIRDTVVKEGDRIINTIISGPHDRIVNKDMYTVWKENHWKTSVKAVHLVMALHDHFTQPRSMSTAAQPESVPSPSHPESDARRVEDTDVVPDAPIKDQWALQYIGVHLVRPLIEVIDEDVSSFVTIAEVNAFTASRPAEWSLPHWIAYWTVGFDSTVRWYYNRIVALLAKLWQAGMTVHPLNINYVTQFLQSDGSWIYIDSVLAAMQQAGSYDGPDRRFNLWSKKFRSYVDQEERRMHEVLESVSHHIDDENTLTLVIGSMRPEQYTLPVTFLLLRRALDIIELGAENILDSDELDLIDRSFRTLFRAVFERMDALKAIHILQNHDTKEYFRRAYHGMYLYLLEKDEMGPYWQIDPFDIAEKSDSLELVTPPNPDDIQDGERVYTLSYESPTSRLEYVWQPPPTPLWEEEPPSLWTSLAGHWSTTYEHEDGRPADSFGSLMIDLTIAGAYEVTGFGTDSAGDFHLWGRFDGRDIKFVKEYGILSGCYTATILFEGSVDEAFQEISGTWGPMSSTSSPFEESESQDSKTSDSPSSPNSSGDEHENGEEVPSEEPAEEPNEQPDEGGEGRSEMGETEIATAAEEEEEEEEEPVGKGTFTFRRRPQLALQCRPGLEEFTQNRSRTLWKFAIDSALLVVRRTHLRWETLRDRRERRKAYIFLLSERRKNKDKVPAEKAAQWKEVVRTNTVEDLRLWRAIGDFYAQRCVILHSTICNVCNTEVMDSVRYTCLQCCVEEVYETIDLCSDCMGKPYSWEGENGKQMEHSTSHNLVQVRYPVPIRYGYAIRDRARNWVTELEDDDSDGGESSSSSRSSSEAEPEDSTESSHTCLTCSESISRPYWYCLDCDGDETYLCDKCNTKVTQERPWLFDYQPLSDEASDKHDWSHILVLFPDTSSDAPTLSVEERLDKLESTLSTFSENQDNARRDFEKSLSARMDRLENLMSQILNAVGKVRGRK